MQLSSTQLAAIDRDNRQYQLATSQPFSTFIQETILDALEGGPVGITADAGDIDSIAKGGGAFSQNPDTTTGLTFGFKAGRFHNGLTLVSVSAGTVALSSSSTNYVEVDRAGTVSANTTAFTSGRLPLYTIVTGASTISTTTVSKPLMTLIGPNGVNGAMLSAAAQTKEVAVTIGTIATGAGSTVVTVNVPKSIAAASKLTNVRFVSAVALSASDTNYVTFGLVNKGAGGVGTQTLVDITAAANSTKATGGTALVAYAGRDLTLVTLSGGSERDVTGGDTIAITITVTGTLGAALTSCSMVLEFTFVN
jgi:hypothetical protein